MYNIVELKKLVGESELYIDESMKDHTTFKAGGKAKILFMPNNKDQIIKILEFANKNSIKTYIIGNGSNVLVSDNGIDGIVIQTCKNMNAIRSDNNKVYVQAGCLLSIVAKKALELELSGFEFASGIPGTIGGAITMNAGAYGNEIKDVIESVDVLIDNKEVVTLSNKEMEFSYRHSVITNTNNIVLGAVISLEKGNKDDIKAKMKELNTARSTKQPLEFPSAGSTFKRPVGHFAGKLIQESGLSGFTIGGAMVSDKHCGFIINHNNATAKDILDLINHVKKVVYNNSGVKLEEEVKLLGEF